MDLRGSFGGIVEDNRDPQKLGRLKVRVPHVYGSVGGVFGAVPTNDLPWALPAGLPNGLTQQSGGADWLPEIGDQVLVHFLDSEPEKPVWLWFMQTHKAVEDFPIHAYETGSGGSVGKPKRGAWVRYGHTVEWNTDGLIVTTSKGYRLLLTDASTAGNDGDISLASQAGQFLEFDDSTGDGTININNDWNINVGEQILAISDSFSLTTLNHEIEFNSGNKLTIDTVDSMEGTVGRDWLMSVTGKTNFDLTQPWTVNAAQGLAFNSNTNLSLAAASDIAMKATGTLSMTSNGVLSITTPASMMLDFVKLSLGGLMANSPFVLGDQLLSYLNLLYSILLNHTHSGVFPGPSSTSVMIPAPPPPPSALLSVSILGR